MIFLNKILKNRAGAAKIIFAKIISPCLDLQCIDKGLGVRLVKLELCAYRDYYAHAHSSSYGMRKGTHMIGKSTYFAILL